MQLLIIHNPKRCASLTSSIIHKETWQFCDNPIICHPEFCGCIINKKKTRSSTEASAHLMVWSCVQACSATADFSSCPLLQVSWCSFSLVSSLRMVFPMYTFPHEHGIWYTTMDCLSTDSGSFTLVSKERRVLPKVNATPTS